MLVKAWLDGEVTSEELTIKRAAGREIAPTRSSSPLRS